MLQLGNCEPLHGTNWKANAVPQPDLKDIFGPVGDIALVARGRYVYSRTKETTYLSGPDDSVRAPPWGSASVTRKHSEWIARPQ
jgi:hypothetical protein